MNRRGFIKLCSGAIGWLSVGGVSLASKTAGLFGPKVIEHVRRKACEFNPMLAQCNAIRCKNTPMAIDATRKNIVKNMESCIPTKYRDRVCFKSSTFDWGTQWGISWQYLPHPQDIASSRFYRGEDELGEIKIVLEMKDETIIRLHENDVTFRFACT